MVLEEKKHEGESNLESVLRELKEEAGISLSPHDLQQIGRVIFFFEEKVDRNNDCHIFWGNYDGEFQESEEMYPQWRDIKDIPYDDMWEDDRIWLPKVIAKEGFEISSYFDKEGNRIK